MPTFGEVLVLAVVVGCSLGPTAARLILHGVEWIGENVARRAANRREYGA